jgi:hypothetical protein
MDITTLKIGVLPIQVMAKIEIIQMTDIKTPQETDIEKTNLDLEAAPTHAIVTDQAKEAVITKVHHETIIDQIRTIPILDLSQEIEEARHHPTLFTKETKM